MSIRVLENFPCGNVRVLENKPGDAEIIFSPDPRGAAEALWFYFKLTDPQPAAAHAAEVRLTLCYFATLYGATEPNTCRPVFRVAGKNWERLRPPQTDERTGEFVRLSWTIPYPVTETEFAFSVPYAHHDLVSTLGHCNGYWSSTDIGLSSAGRPLERLGNAARNGQAACPNPHGLYLIARRYAGETPGSWVLDGLLDAISRAKPVNWCVRAVPFASLDAVIDGSFGRGASAPSRETVLIRKDIETWSTLCKPELVLDLQAPGASETGKVRALASPAGDEKMDKAVKAWCNVLANALQPDFADADFCAPAPGEPDALRTFVQTALACPFIPVLTPYAVLGGQTVMQKQYREIGRDLARAILSRW